MQILLFTTLEFDDYQDQFYRVVQKNQTIGHYE